MIKKFTTCLMICCMLFAFSRCNEDEASSPPQSSFSVDQSSGLVNDTEFTFTIDQVNADAISLLPYGTAKKSLGGILINSFEDGKAVVKFTYAQVGTFEAVVVTNNHTADGESVKTTVSDPITITITSDRSAITEFSFEKSTSTTIDQDAKTIHVVVPYGTDVTSLKAKYTASPFTTVTVGGTAQKSDETVNNFTNAVTYTVTADNGSATSQYVVTVEVTPIETDNTLKSASGKVAGTAEKDKVLPAYIDNDNDFMVIYNVFGTPTENFDSIRLAYAVNGQFAYVKYGGEKLTQDSLLDLTASKQIQVYSQDSLSAGGIATYTVYAAAAPKLSLSFPALIPAVTGENDNFTINLKVLKGTDIESITTSSQIDEPSGVLVTGIRVKPGSSGVWSSFVSGQAVDYSQDVQFELTVQDTNIGVTYKVIYTASVLVLN